MCGISGYIGESKDPELTYDIITNVFKITETRGTDAAGFWGVDTTGKVFYHKEPVRSSELVKHSTWQELSGQKLDMLFVHARAASQGVGEPHTNKNNHPFTSTDKEISLIHNGRIPEFDTLKKKFQVLSDCDSEVILRIIESGDAYDDSEIIKEFGNLPIEIGRRMMGIRDVFSLINHGHMAVAFGERHADGRRNMWLFRNKHRSLWIVDLRAPLGQIFFCSTPDIWQDALADCKTSLGSVQKLIELPPEEVWHFQINGKARHPSKVNRYQVCRENNATKWDENTTPLPVQKKEVTAEVVTKLNDQEELSYVIKKKVDEPTKRLKRQCSEIREVVSRIRTVVYNKIREGSMSDSELSDLLESLHSAEKDLQGTLRLLL